MHKIEREMRTVSLMIGMWCRAKHNRDQLCDDCRELELYAHERLTRCTYGPHKGLCKTCQIHCYRPVMREKVRVVMRYAGPKMLLRHPVTAIRHLFNI